MEEGFEFEVVKKWGEYTYRNKKTGELCSQRFKFAYDVCEGWAKVKTKDGWTFFNPNTKELCKQRFKFTYSVREGWAEVDTGGGWTLFNPELDKTFQSKFDFGCISIKTCLREHPEDFALLPTVQFRDQKEIESYLYDAAEGIKARCPKQGSTEEAEAYANKIKTLIAEKIKTEKENIRRIDKEAEAKAKKEQEEQAKKEKEERERQQAARIKKEKIEQIATTTADEIKGMGSLLNDDEAEI